MPSNSEVFGYPASRLQLNRVPLAVSKAQGAELESAALRDGGRSSGVHPSAEEDDGGRRGHPGKLDHWPGRSKK